MAAAFCKTVWVIDDDELSNFLNETILKTQQLAQSIISFTTIDEALSSLNLASRQEIDFPDVILLDMEMPGLDGWDFLEKFNEVPKEVKGKCRLYMLSSSLNEVDALKARKHEDVCDFIVKPLTVKNVEAIKASCTR